MCYMINEITVKDFKRFIKLNSIEPDTVLVNFDASDEVLSGFSNISMDGGSIQFSIDDALPDENYTVKDFTDFIKENKLKSDSPFIFYDLSDSNKYPIHYHLESIFMEGGLNV